MTLALFLGLLIGMTHALEADHLAAIAAFSVRKNSLRDSLKHSFSWGVGHTTTLFLVVVPVFLLGGQISEVTEVSLEMLVGFMLIFLGANVVYRLWRDRVHLHVHSHADDQPHIHFHSHKNETTPHESSPHGHAHRPILSAKAFGIGLVHGVAGAAALLVFAQSQIHQTWLVVPFVLLFGIGSILGMTLISKAISIPIRLAGAHVSLSFGGLKLAVAAVTIGLGINLAISGALALMNREANLVHLVPTEMLFQPAVKTVASWSGDARVCQLTWNMRVKSC